MDRNASAPTILVHAGRLTPNARSRTPRSWRSLLQRDRMLELGACIGIGLVALGLFLYHTRDVSLWYDELYSVELSRLPWPVFWKVHQANMLLYYLLLRAWLDVTGFFGVVPSPLIVRLPSIIMMALAAIVIVLLGSRFWNLTTGVLAGLLFVLNGLVLQQAQQARGYALQVLLVCLAWWALLLALKTPTAVRWWVAFAILSTLAFYTQFLSVFVIAAQALGVAVLLLPPIARRIQDFPICHTRGWRAFLVPGGIALASIVVLALPLALDARQHRGDVTWVPVATSASLWDFVQVQTGYNSFAAIALLAAIALGVVLSLSMRRGLALLLISWGVTPVMGQYLVTQPYLNLHLFYPRYVIPALPALVLLAAIGVTALRPYWGAIGISLLLLALMAQTPGAYYRDAELQPFLETTSWMEHQYTNGDGIICRPDTKACGIPMSYYLEHLYRGKKKLPTQFPGIYVWDRFRSTSTQDAALASYLKDHKRVFVFTVAVVGRDPNTVKDTVPQMLISSGYRLVGTYRPATKGHLGDVEVDEYSR